MEFCFSLSFWCFSLAIGLSIWAYLASKRNQSHWSEKGISGPAPRFIFGNFLERTFSELNELNVEWSQKYGPVFGFYHAFQPALMITDPELIKQVTIKDFHHFMDRFNFPIYHEMWNQNLFLSQGENWRRIRAILSPTFTSGKLRGMHHLMAKAVHKLEQHLDRLIATEDGLVENRVFNGFTIDVIASAVFALETNANSDRPEDKLFMQNGNRIFNFPIMRLIAMCVLPTFVLDVLGIDTPFEPQSFEFFIKLTRHILSERRQLINSSSCGAQKQNDFVQLLLDASLDEETLDNKADYEEQLSVKDEVENEEKNVTKSLTKENTDNQLTDTEIIANMIIFFTAGFESTSSTISYCIFALVHNPDVQERLHQELSRALDKFENDDNSEQYLGTVLSGVPYLEAVIKETLRLYTPVNELHRLCLTEGYQLGQVRLSKNDGIFISTAAVHLNADYYPAPDMFKPERFMPENKHLLVPYTFLPFGAGPRNCIGMRFAHQEIKLCISRLVRLYRFSVTPNTPQKLTFKKGQPLRISLPFEVKVEKRSLIHFVS